MAALNLNSDKDLQRFVDNFNYLNPPPVAMAREIIRLREALAAIARLGGQHAHACDAANEAIEIARKALDGGAA